MKTVKELQEQLNKKRDELNEIFEKAKTDDGLKMSAEQVEDVRARNKELDDLGRELETARELDEAYEKNRQAIRDSHLPETDIPLPGTRQDQKRQPVKTLGQRFVEAKEYKERQRSKPFVVDMPDVELKTLMERTAGYAPESLRLDRTVFSAQRRPVVGDLMPNTPTSMAAIKYMEETTFTNNAAALAEGGQLAESALQFTEQTDPVESIGTWLPVTDEQLEDVDQAMSIVDNRLMLMLALAEEAQLVTGSGVAPNLTGYLNKAGIQTQALGADTVPDAFYKAITKVRFTGFADPTGFVIHPNDWQGVRLLRTVDGIYIWGSPAEQGPERMWGLPGVVTPVITENTGLVGDFQLYSELFRKRGATVEVSNSHSDFFIKRKQAIRIDERVVLVIYRAAAFCTVTGI